jgi:hypothetical protein
MFEERLLWEKNMEQHGSRTKFKRHLGMSPKSFNKLLSFINSDLEVNKKQSSRRGGFCLPTEHSVTLLVGITLIFLCFVEFK